MPKAKEIDECTFQTLESESAELTISEIASKTNFSSDQVRESLLRIFGIKL